MAMGMGDPVVLDPEEVRRRLGAFAGPEDIKRAFNIPDGNYVIGVQPPKPSASDTEAAMSNAPDYALRTATEELARGIAGGPGGRGYAAAFQPPAGYEESRRGPVAPPPSVDSPALTTALNTSAMSPMLPAGAGVLAPPVGTGTVLRPEQDFTAPAPPSAPPISAQTEAAPSSSSSIRAIKMPDGKIVFTNRPEYTSAVPSKVSSGGGTEISREDAVADIRSNDRALSPTRLALSDLVRKSVERSNRVGPDVGGGFTNADETSEPSAYVQEARTRGALDRLDQLTAMARAKSDLDVARRTPEEQAALGTKEIQITEYMQRSAKPRLDAIRSQADEAISMIPQITRDPAQQAEMRRRIEQKRDNDIQDVMNILAIGSGLRPQPAY